MTTAVRPEGPGNPMRHRASRLALAVLLTVAACTGLAAGPAAVATAAPGDGSRYVPITPTRVLDTRTAGDTPLGGGQTRVIDFGKLVARQIDAVVLNVTTVNATAGGYLTVFPHGVTRPTASNAQHPKGVARASSVTVRVTNQGTGRYVDVFNNAGSVDLVVDLFGFYVDDTASSGLTPSTYGSRDERVYDSRTSGGAFGNGAARAVVVSTGGSQSTLKAVAVNLTVVAPGGAGYLQAWSGAGTPPTVSSVNFVKGRTTPNFAIVPVRCADPGCTSASITIRNVSASAHVVVDVLGLYTTSDLGARYYSGTPFRIIDTRASGAGGALGPGQSVSALTGGTIDPVPEGANLTITAVAPTATTYLQAYPPGSSTTTSTVNALAGEVVANAAQVGTDTFSLIEVRNSAGTTHVVVDLNGYFATPCTGGCPS